MCPWAVKPVGESNVPAMMAIRPSPVGSQNRLAPHCAQNPRLADADDWYHCKLAEDFSKRSSRAQAVAATKCPLVRRHISQWQKTTGLNGPCTSYCTPLQRQWPVAVAAVLVGIVMVP